jgi:Tfp pilus assembly protein PilV
MGSRLRSKPVQAEGGFTLFEVAVALGVLVLGFLGFLVVIGQAAQLNVGNKLRSAASVEVNRVVEEIQGTPFSTILTQYAPKATTIDTTTWYEAGVALSEGAAQDLVLDGSDVNTVKVYFLTEVQAKDEFEQSFVDLDGDGDMDETQPAADWEAYALRVEVSWSGATSEGTSETRSQRVSTIVYALPE